MVHEGFPADEVERWDGLYEPAGPKRRFGLFQASVQRRVLERREQALALLGRASGGRLLDLACGAGRFKDGARQQGWKWMGLDRSSAMLRRPLGPEARPPLVQGDVRWLPWRGESAQGVLCVGILSYFRDQLALKILAEIFRVLSTQGVAIVQTVRLDPLAYVRSRLPAWIPRPLRIPGPLYPRSMAALEQLVRRAGLAPERCVALTKFGGLPAATLLRAHKPERGAVR